MSDVKNCILCGKTSIKIICDDCHSNYFNKVGKFDFENSTFALKLIGFTTNEERKLIYKLKTKNDKRLQKFIANEISNVLEMNMDENQHANVQITYIPRRDEGIRDFKFDHKKNICDLVAKKMQIKEQKLFCFNKMKDGTYSLSYAKAKIPNINTLIILDDHIESGQTMKRAINLAYGAGVKNVIVFAISK